MYVMVWLYVRTYVAIRHEIGSLIKYVLFQVGVRWVANRSVWVIGGGGVAHRRPILAQGRGVI